MRCIALITSKNINFYLQDMNNFISNYVNTQNPITKFFNKINYVKLDGDYSKMIE